MPRTLPTACWRPQVRSWSTRETLYVEQVKGLTKTRQGGLEMDCRLPQKLSVTDDEQCPVRFLEQLILKWPKSLSSVGPLYLRPVQKPQPDLWYSSLSAGVHKINSFMREIVTLTGLDCTSKRFTNWKKAGVSNDRWRLTVVNAVWCRNIIILHVSYASFILVYNYCCLVHVSYTCLLTIHASSWGEPERAIIADLMVCHAMDSRWQCWTCVLSWHTNHALLVTAGFITACMSAVPWAWY